MADTSLIFNIIARDKTSATFEKIKGGAAIAGAAIGAGLMGAAAQAMEKSRLDNKVAAQLGATPEQAKEIGKLSSQLYASGFGEDMPQVATAIKDAAQNGLVDVKNISSETSKAAAANLLTVSSVLEEDTARTSAAVSQMLRTGLASSSEEAMDLLIAATQKGVNKSQDLLDTVNEYGTQFRKLGLDGPAAMGLMSQAIQAGARDSDTAADALKEFSIRAIDGSKAAADGYKLLGLDAEAMMAKVAAGGPGAEAALGTVLDKLRGMKDPVKQSAAAVGLFGTKAEDLGTALYAMDVDTATQQMGNIAGATEKAATQATQGAAGWGTLGRQFQSALIDKLNMALPVVNAVFGFMQKNSDWIGPLITGLGVMAVAIGVITAAQWAWNIALTANPIGLVVAAIVGLVAVIAVVATKTRFFQTIWQHVWGFMKGVGAWFAGPFAGFFVSMWNKVTSKFNQAKNDITSKINAVKLIFTVLKNHAVSMFNKVIDKAGNVVSWFKAMPGKIKGALTNMFSGLWTGFKRGVNLVIGGWNRLSFTVGGGSFMGMNIPSFTLDTPNLPYLASGARNVRESGLAVIHRGEQVRPAKVTRWTGADTAASMRPVLVIKSDSSSRIARLLLELLREAIRDRGGDPVKVLTPR